MRTIKLVVEYDGTDFAGYQSQGKGERTVQSVLMATASTILQHDVVLHAAGRTDTGVHALGQVISFRTTSALPIERMAIALNGQLPYDISVASAAEMDQSFHARYSAVARTYRYLVWTRRTRSAIWGRYSLHMRRPLNVPLMAESAKLFVGSMDFAAFKRAGGNPGPTTVRRVDRLSVRRMANGSVLFTVTANSFLRSMVRNLVGALLEVGVGDLPPDTLSEILESKDRTANPCPPAAPHGLCLMRVDY